MSASGFESPGSLENRRRGVGVEDLERVVRRRGHHWSRDANQHLGPSSGNHAERQFADGQIPERRLGGSDWIEAHVDAIR